TMSSLAFPEGWFSPNANQFTYPVTTVTPKWTDFPGAMIRIVLVLAGLVAIFQAPAQAACAPPIGGGVAICSPHNGSNDVNPVHYIAAASSATCTAGISTMSIVSSSGSPLYSIGGSTLDTFLPQRPGAYTTIVK